MTLAVTKRPSLKELAAQAHRMQQVGAENADVAVEASGLSAEEMKSVEQLAKVDPHSEQALADLRVASNLLTFDPFTRQSYLRGRLETLAIEPAAPEEGPAEEWQVDYKQVVQLFEDALAPTFGDGKKAFPLFVLQPSGRDDRERWKNFLYFVQPRLEDGTLRVRNLKLVTPTMHDDTPALLAFKKLRKPAMAGLLAELAEGTLGDLRQYVLPALYLLPGATIYGEREADRTFESIDDDLLKRGKKTFVSYRLSSKEVFVAEKSKQSLEFVELLAANRDLTDRFWKGEIDSRQDAVGFITDNADSLISVDDFLDGRPGIIAIEHLAWRDKQRESAIAVNVVFIRRDDGTWRWAISNPDGVRSLFGGGKRLLHHTWSQDALPPHIVAFLRHGNVIEPDHKIESEPETAIEE